jgi:hypothetical protein
VAIFEDAGQSAHYVGEERQAARRVVVPGVGAGDFTEVRDGLDLEALVDTKGQREWRDGVGVEVLEGPADVLEQLAAEKSDDSAKADPEAGDGGGGSGRADSAPHAP